MDREERRRVAGGEVERIVRMDGCASELGMREAEERRRKRRRRDRNEAVLGGGGGEFACEEKATGFGEDSVRVSRGLGTGLTARQKREYQKDRI